METQASLPTFSLHKSKNTDQVVNCGKTDRDRAKGNLASYPLQLC